MTHQKPAADSASKARRPANSPAPSQMVTLEPCTKCRQMAVCLPVTGRHGRRAYPYWCRNLLATGPRRQRNRGERRNRPYLDALQLLRRSLPCAPGHFSCRPPPPPASLCEATCWSVDRLAEMELVPTCSDSAAATCSPTSMQNVNAGASDGTSQKSCSCTSTVSATSPPKSPKS